ncbi:MAG TPA: hypothetical protein VIP79_07395 [Gemmatimonadaceae bacterium]
MSDEPFRAAVLRSHGARGGEVAELLAYARNMFDLGEAGVLWDYPLPDEPSVAAWERYAAEAAEVGTAECLRRRLVQLQFPIAAGMSSSAAYRAATRRGEPGVARHADGVALVQPAELRIAVHPTAAGRVPVVVAGAREDFVSLVQALVHRNEPVSVPDSMGACIVAGYNNWDRIAELRAEWAREEGRGCSSESWAQAFRRVVPMTELYQDSFILLSSGPYSAIPASAMGLDEGDWLEKSRTIRLEHECTHYFTRRALGSMRNSLLDELIADYMGIVAAAGRYRAGWFLRFMGLEAFPRYRSGGRLENYRGDPPLTDGAFVVLQSLVRSAAEQLERFDAVRSSLAGRREQGRGLVEGARVIVALARLGLETLASEEGAELLGSIARGLDRKACTAMTPV